MMRFTPAVFAVGENYQILVPVSASSLMWVRVGDQCFYDDNNGVLRSETDMHRMTVPMSLLDAAGAYTICERMLPHRRAYFSKPKPVEETAFSFYPVPKNSARAYLMSDAHCRTAEPIRAAKAFGDIDFLLFNGDMPENSDRTRHFNTIFEIADALLGGTKPIVFARGNHDLRGIYAEKYTEYTPNADGKFYYTFRLGSIWGIVLDCGEDKVDDQEEYGGTICCHAFRKQETAFLERVCAEKDYLADDIMTRVVLVHSPFTHRFGPPFNIEEELYTYWSALLRDHIQPDVMLCGHTHTIGVHKVGSDFDHFGQPCTVVVSGKPGKDWYSGAGVVFDDGKITVQFTDSDGETSEVPTTK